MFIHSRYGANEWSKKGFYQGLCWPSQFIGVIHRGRGGTQAATALKRSPQHGWWLRKSVSLRAPCPTCCSCTEKRVLLASTQPSPRPQQYQLGKESCKSCNFPSLPHPLSHSPFPPGREVSIWRKQLQWKAWRALRDFILGKVPEHTYSAWYFWVHRFPWYQYPLMAWFNVKLIF